MKGLAPRMQKKKKKKQPPNIASQSKGRHSRISPLSQQRSLHSGEFWSSQSRVFNVKLYVVEAQELYTVNECYYELTMKNLKSRLELLVGIPVNFQRLQYLDEVDLADDSTFRKNDIIPGGTLSMRIWPEDAWGSLVSAATKGKIKLLKQTGATKTSFFSTANANLMRPEERNDWLAHRMFVALFITTRRGHLEAVEFLLQNGTDLRWKTPLGRTALHVAATSGQANCIDMLLTYGAKINDEDYEGHNAIVLARLWGQKESERHLSRHQWTMRLGRRSARNLIKSVET